jgi:molybdate transport system permease protein
LLSPAEADALRVSLTVAAGSVVVNLPLALWIAWRLVRRPGAWTGVLSAFAHLPLVLPPVVVGYLLLLLLGRHGVLGAWLDGTFGLRLAFSTSGASIATAVMTFPLMLRALRLSLEGIDPGLESAARTLGAGPIDRFVSITLPLMLPGIIAGIITAFAAGLGEFGAVITFAGNIPGVTRTLPLALYTALQSPDGEGLALRLASLSVTAGVAGLLTAEWLARRIRRQRGG